MRRKFQGIWIPQEIWLSAKLTPREKMFLVEINSLDNGERGCYANNRHFADLFHVSKNTASRVIQSLVEKTLVILNVDKKSGNKRTLKVRDGILTPYPQKGCEGVAPERVRGSPQKGCEAIPQNGDSPIGVNGEHILSTVLRLNTTNNNNETKGISIKSGGLDLELQKAGLKYASAIESMFGPFTPAQVATFERISYHLVKYAQQHSSRVFEMAIDWAADKLDYTLRHPGKNKTDAIRMFIAEVKKRTGYTGQGRKAV